MVITGQKALFAYIQGHKEDGRIFTAPERFVERLGLRTAVLLSQMLFWTDRTKDVDGWFSKTQKEWSRELHLSEYEVKDSIRKLRELGLVQMATRAVKYGTTNMVRVALDKLTIWWNSTHPPVEIQPTPPVETVGLNTQMIGIDDTLDDSCSATGEQGTLNQKACEEEETMALKEGLKPSVKGVVLQSSKVIKVAVQKALDAPPTLATKGKRATVPELALLWKQAVPKYTSVSFVSVTNTEAMMLKALVRKWEETNTDYMEVLEYIIKNWIPFTKRVESDVGLKVVPDVPKIAFLVKYGGEAMNYWMSRKEKKDGSKVLAVPAPVAISCTTQPKTDQVAVPEIEEKPVSLDELNAWIAENT